MKWTQCTLFLIDVCVVGCVIWFCVVLKFVLGTDLHNRLYDFGSLHISQAGDLLSRHIVGVRILRTSAGCPHAAFQTATRLLFSSLTSAADSGNQTLLFSL